jgi:hypothetical protein
MALHGQDFMLRKRPLMLVNCAPHKAQPIARLARSNISDLGTFNAP